MLGRSSAHNNSNRIRNCPPGNMRQYLATLPVCKGEGGVIQQEARMAQQVIHPPSWDKITGSPVQAAAATCSRYYLRFFVSPIPRRQGV